MRVGIHNILKIISGHNVSAIQVRFYSRWSHRTPLKVYSAEEYEDMEKASTTDNSPNAPQDFAIEKHKPPTNIESIKHKIKPKKSLQPLVATNQKSKLKKTLSVDMLQTVIDGDGNYVYTKMNNHDQRVGSILTEIKSKKEKTNKDLILLEGKRLIRDALQSGCRLRYILFSRQNEIDYLKPYLPKVGAELYRMPYREIQLWSDLTTNPGVMGIFNTPSTEDIKPKSAIPLSIVCDNIREPGNLGSILRIAAGVGCAKVFLTKGCVHLWDSKVLRSSVGAHFKLALQRNLEWKEIENVIGDNANYLIADNKVVNSDSDPNEVAHVLQGIPFVPYYSVDFCTFNHTVIVVGGETHGISKEAYELAAKTQGVRLNIPLTNQMDSLNVGTAVGIIAFEIRKQLVHVH